MPSPTTSSSTSSVGQATSLTINALLGGVKWGGAVGTGITLSYSFPWTTSTSATFSGYNGSGDYSTLNEQSATTHYGLSASQQVAARSALQAWSNVANVTFSEVAESSTNVGDIRLAWTSATQTSSTGSRAWGWASYPNSYWPVAGDIWISTLSTGATDPDWSVGSYNYEALMHELGHALGLKHPFEGSPVLSSSQDSRQYTVMSYTDQPNSLFRHVIANSNGTYSYKFVYVKPDTPMLYDIAAMQYLYGANLSYKAGNDVYTFDPATPFLRTLWDAGGTDTISVSNFSNGCLIDLQPGHYSNITILSDPLPPNTSGGTTPTYDGTSNLAIALGCIIENAVGGSGNDTLRGNDANNSLDGGAGNDTLYGGAGNDTFDSDASARGGNDVFYGGAGNDTYVLNSALDRAIEYLGEGTDTVWVSVSYSLADLPNIENISAFGTAALTLTGNAASNSFKGTSANDTIVGGLGTDTIQYAGSRSNFSIARLGNGFTVTDHTGAEGLDTLQTVERLKFADGAIALDMGTTQSGGETQLLLGAVLGKDLLATKPSMSGAVIDLFDQGYTLQQLSGAVMRLPIWNVLTGKVTPTNTDIANYLLGRLNGVAPDSSTLASAVSALDAQPDITHNQGDFLWHLAESAANQAMVGLVGLAATGLAFAV